MRRNVPSTGIATSWSRSDWVWGPACHACTTFAWLAAVPVSPGIGRKSMPGASTSREYPIVICCPDVFVYVTVRLTGSGSTAVTRPRRMFTPYVDFSVE